MIKYFSVFLYAIIKYFSVCIYMLVSCNVYEVPILYSLQWCSHTVLKLKTLKSEAVPIYSAVELFEVNLLELGAGNLDALPHIPPPTVSLLLPQIPYHADNRVWTTTCFHCFTKPAFATPYTPDAAIASILQLLR